MRRDAVPEADPHAPVGPHQARGRDVLADLFHLEPGDLLAVPDQVEQVTALEPARAPGVQSTIGGRASSSTWSTVAWTRGIGR